MMKMKHKTMKYVNQDLDQGGLVSVSPVMLPYLKPAINDHINNG